MVLDYSLFGLKHKGYNNVINGTDHPYGFGGKEESNDPFDWTTLDFGARNYDPAIGRWMNLDPLAEKMRRHSPYNYAFDNPIYWTDPDGMEPSDRWKRGQDGTLTWVSNEGGDTTDYVDNVDADGNVTSTEVYDVVDSRTVSETNEMDFLFKEPGSRTGAYGRGRGIKPLSFLDAGSEVADKVVTEVASEVGVSPVIATIFAIIINPKDAAKKIKKLTKGKKTSLKEQANSLKNDLNGGKNSVHVKTPNGLVRYDLDGRAHGNVPTPHVQSYKVNKNPNTGRTNLSRTSKTARPMNQQDMRSVRKVLEKRTQANGN